MGWLPLPVFSAPYFTEMCSKQLFSLPDTVEPQYNDLLYNNIPDKKHFPPGQRYSKMYGTKTDLTIQYNDYNLAAKT